MLKILDVWISSFSSPVLLKTIFLFNIYYELRSLQAINTTHFWTTLQNILKASIPLVTKQFYNVFMWFTIMIWKKGLLLTNVWDVANIIHLSFSLLVFVKKNFQSFKIFLSHSRQKIRFLINIHVAADIIQGLFFFNLWWAIKKRQLDIT